MKITAPISRVEEIQLLAEAGADEFYCSVVPESWMKEFKTSGVSRRAFGNLPSFDDLERAVNEAHRLDKELFLVMNSQHYTGVQIQCLLELAQVFDDFNGDAVIVGDETLLALLASHNFNFSIHLSSIASCRNKEAAQFHRELGADRIIFPRDMKLNEIQQMINSSQKGSDPNLEFEAFILNDGCAFEEGSCHTIHLPGKLGGAICMDNYQTENQRIDGQPLNKAEQAAFAQNDTDYQRWIWYRFGNGFSVNKEGLPYGPCGLCALPKLVAAGLTSVKIAGRDMPTDRKIKSVQMVSQIRDALQHGDDYAKALARGLRKEPAHCQTGYMCYYPEVRMEPDNEPAWINAAPIAVKNI